MTTNLAPWLSDEDQIGILKMELNNPKNSGIKMLIERRIQLLENKIKAKK